jgi:hypothetical protein
MVQEIIDNMEIGKGWSYIGGIISGVILEKLKAKPKPVVQEKPVNSNISKLTGMRKPQINYKMLYPKINLNALYGKRKDKNDQ